MATDPCGVALAFAVGVVVGRVVECAWRAVFSHDPHADRLDRLEEKADEGVRGRAEVGRRLEGLEAELLSDRDTMAEGFRLIGGELIGLADLIDGGADDAPR